MPPIFQHPIIVLIVGLVCMIYAWSWKITRILFFIFIIAFLIGSFRDKARIAAQRAAMEKAQGGSDQTEQPAPQPAPAPPPKHSNMPSFPTK